ncbi:hypothetical protein TcWFU_002468 [Taenia crassiceps]|uniref:Uncharacterized protein n=1 Tax=Taenia crassiceps TaxID=6207 RepID=A0ABR4QD51_9CEST
MSFGEIEEELPMGNWNRTLPPSVTATLAGAYPHSTVTSNAATLFNLWAWPPPPSSISASPLLSLDNAASPHTSLISYARR